MKVGWQKKTLGDIAMIGAGNPAPQADDLFENGTFPFFRTADAGRIRFGAIFESSDYLNDKGIKGLRLYPKGTILFPKSGASTFLNHRVMLGVDGYVSSHLATIIAEDTIIDSSYLLYFLSTISAQDLIQDHAYPSLNLDIISSIRVLFPPLPEQQRIVKILDKTFESIATAKANAEKNLLNAKALFESYLNDVFTKRGEGWEKKHLKDVCVLQRGFDLPTRQRINGKFPLVSSSGIIDTHNVGPIKGPCIVTGRSGSIGNLFYIDEDFWPLNTVLYVKDFHGNYPKFVYWLLKHFDLKRFSTGTGVPTLNRNFVHDEWVNIPESKTTQRDISKRLDTMVSEVNRLSSFYARKLDSLDELIKSLLHKAFQGEL